MLRSSRSVRCALRGITVLALVGASACGDGHDYRFTAEPSQAGMLDPRFGTGGVVLTDFGAGLNSAEDVVVLADGRILVGGMFGVGEGPGFGLVRYLPKGALDPSFGVGGIVTTPESQGPLPHRNGAALAGIALAPDGSIGAFGCLEIIPPCDWTVARYEADGALDTRFAGGVVILPVYAPRADAIAFTADGNMLLAGTTAPDETNDTDYMVARLTPTGELDPRFGRNGWVVVDVVEDAGEAILVQPDGKIVIGGCSGEAFTLIRLLPDGARDPSFGVNGVAMAPLDLVQGTVRQLVAVPGDGILAGGSGEANPRAVVRFRDDGSFDRAFGRDGVAGLDFVAGAGSLADLALQPDGKIVVSGPASFPDQFYALRLRADGIPDPEFGTGGVVTTMVGDFGESRAVALAPDGGILVAGLAIRSNTYSALVRYTGR